MKFSKVSALLALLLSLLIMMLILYSFKDVSLSSIKEIVIDNGFLSAVKFGFLTATMATFFSAIFGIPAGYYLARHKKGFSKVLDVFFDVPLIIPPLVVGVLILNLFNSPFLSKFFNVIFDFKGAVIAQFFISFPFTLKSAKSAFELVPPIYERIAMTLGAGYFRSFYDTTFKLAFRGIAAGIMLSWLRSFGEFGATLMVAGGIPGKTENVPINIYLNMTEGNFEKGIAASVLTVILAFLVISIIKIIFDKRRWDDA
ncbi:molybdate ABC transporter, permease [Deferribacter desulfuricans SSM1]|uniref:Molybdate ABC transporter, permease n=1 Tax=Deferribacter desulfuricans (strain DSM 14783 / JCM 11476 / NBRC 101012 / SSM1) TaxID=639282 RepID=D3PCH9_DEFDS|nr:ABC transporter permease subunit [Deferribacter desulfuricans]BAI80302.1 molybdate ABC transporter, permease [Deferribacter desulfuricans SSM1]